MTTLTPIDEAAKAVNLTLMVSLHREGEQGHTSNTRTMAYAASSGNLECLRYLHENGCEWDWRATANAAYGGYLECLRYLHEHGCEWNVWAIDNASGNGHLDCLKYLHENGCQWDTSSTVLCAAAKGHLECLRYLHKSGCPFDSCASSAAAFNGQLACLKYLYEHGCKWDNDSFTHIYKNGWEPTSPTAQLDCLQYLYDNGCPISIEACIKATSFSLDFDRHVWLREFLFPYVHVNSDDLPLKLKEKCNAKIAQIKLEKQALQYLLVDKLPFDVVKHCVVVFI